CFVVKTFQDCATNVFVRIDNQSDWTNHARDATGGTENRQPVLHWESTCGRWIFVDDVLRAEAGYDIAHINMPPVSTHRQAFEPFRAVHSSVGPFIRNFRMQERVSEYPFRDLWLGQFRKRIGNSWVVLRSRGRQLCQLRCVKRLGITATPSKRADILPILRLPADRYFRLLRVIRGVRCRDGWGDCRTQHRRGVLAVPLLALGKVHLKAVETGPVPCGTGKWYPHFLVD